MQHLIYLQPAFMDANGFGLTLINGFGLTFRRQERYRLCALGN